ncbi:hypothetical protein [Nocardiopsis sp. LDBS1602]|uniref:hypothetical protein n=1 Tax=Nocardiopsis sp. LDBS1602 TaxID=3109597 RepID=UPI002DBB5349|nr:hypothetical protein [Nocardiopsis sp. LDBS1602]MEC3895562.1 hypothetical protein [Nocardiopsis sp. LDBS1602]
MPHRPARLLALTAAVTFALTACGGEESVPEEETAPTEEAAVDEEPTTEAEEASPEFAFPEDCDAAGALDVVRHYQPADVERVNEETTDEGGIRCLFGSHEAQNGVNLVYSEGFTLADMPDIEDNYEVVAESQDRELYLTDRASELGGLLEISDMGEVDTGRGALLHLPGGVFVAAMSIGRDDIDQALTEEEMDELLVDAAEALIE